ncbi:transmembrane protein 220-like isoform X2 [Rhopilema esculentum]|uniref:transmembrane protein 220-like isoform X2 n=1 Tax=Rhopilema esculentum TaxID=499914 RepID=UPI0031D62D46
MWDERLTILSAKQSELRSHEEAIFIQDCSRKQPWYLDCGCRSLSWKQILWRVINGLMAVIFGAAAVLQWNDPDSHAWTTVYIIPCLLSIGVTIWIHIQDFILWKVLAALHLSACVGGMIYLSITYGEKISAASPNITSVEEGWELCGLLVVILWLALAIIIASYRSCWMCFIRQTRGLPSRVIFRNHGQFEPEPLD